MRPLFTCALVNCNCFSLLPDLMPILASQPRSRSKAAAPPPFSLPCGANAGAAGHPPLSCWCARHGVLTAGPRTAGTAVRWGGAVGLALALQCLQVLSGAGGSPQRLAFSCVCTGLVPVAPAVDAMLAGVFLVPWWHRLRCNACVVSFFMHV